MGDADLLIFDADGSLRRRAGNHRGAPRGPGDWVLLPGVRETLMRLDWTRVRLGIATNQPDVALGRVSLAMARGLIDEMLGAAGVPTAARLIEICPHDKKSDCICRKPMPGMIVRLLDAARVTRGRAVMFGNAAIDRQAARRAGVRYHDAPLLFQQEHTAIAAVRAITQSVTPT